MSQSGEHEPDTIELRLTDYERWSQFCKYLGGGLAGLVLFGDLAKDSFESAPHWMRALFITLVVVAGIFLGRAYVGYVFSASTLEKKRMKEGWTNDNLMPTEKEYAYPEQEYFCFWVALIFGFCSAILLCIAAWQA